MQAEIQAAYLHVSVEVHIHVVASFSVPHDD